MNDQIMKLMREWENKAKSYVEDAKQISFQVQKLTKEADVSIYKETVPNTGLI